MITTSLYSVPDLAFALFSVRICWWLHCRVKWNSWFVTKGYAWLGGRSYTSASEKVSLHSWLLQHIPFGLNPHIITKTTTYLCIARFAKLLDFPSRNISIFITLSAFIHSEPSTYAALPGSCIFEEDISLQFGEAFLAFLVQGVWKDGRITTLNREKHIKKAKTRLPIKAEVYHHI